jgi:pimeloyl-ACP methyl ester carboxylesterase
MMAAVGEGRRLDVAPGVSLHAQTWPGGDSGRRPYLLVHGLSSNCRTWEGVAELLHDAGHPVAAIDLRGHGRSDKPDDGYDFATMVADVVAALDILGFERPVVAGQSTGGNLAVEVARRAPGRLGAVAGVDGGTLELSRRWPRWEDCERALAPPHLEGKRVTEVEAHLRRAHPDWSNAGVAATLANFELRPDGSIRPYLTSDRHLEILRSLWKHRPSTAIPRLSVPVLFVLADTDDEWMPTKKQEAEDALAAGSHVRVEWLVGDHDLHVQQPAAVANLLRTWQS